jgi:hypothetical protein
MLIIYCISLILPYLYGIATGQLVPRQTLGSYYAVTGAVGGVHPRLEIRELQRNPIMWNLFLLALTTFQDTDQNQIDSYYQIAGKSSPQAAPMSADRPPLQGSTVCHGQCHHPHPCSYLAHAHYLIQVRLGQRNLQPFPRDTSQGGLLSAPRSIVCHLAPTIYPTFRGSAVSLPVNVRC